MWLPFGLGKETPPRAWGRLNSGELSPSLNGNTPTSVGKTLVNFHELNIMQKHPHERGEDLKGKSSVLLYLETPPRAWGRLFTPRGGENGRRNTPTSVGKTRMWNRRVKED